MKKQLIVRDHVVVAQDPEVLIGPIGVTIINGCEYFVYSLRTHQFTQLICDRSEQASVDSINRSRTYQANLFAKSNGVQWISC